MDIKNNIASLAAKLISPYSIIDDFEKITLESDDLPIYGYAAHIYHNKKNSSESMRPEASGVSFNCQDALMATLGEAVERYSWLSLSSNMARLLRESQITQNKIAVEKMGFLLRSDLDPGESFRILKDTKIPWIKGKNLESRREVLLPAIDLFPTLAEEVRGWSISTTNGIAAHFDFYTACLNGICEVIERDAVMLCWYLRSKIKSYSMDASIPGLCELIEKSRVMNLNVRILDITNDLNIPCALAAIYQDMKGSECLACGAACRISIEEACVKSISEAAGMWNSLPVLKKSREPLAKSEVRAGFPNISNFEDHVLLYAHSWAKEAYGFLLQKNTRKSSRRNITIDFGSSKQKLDFIVAVLKRKGYESFFVDITPEDLRSIGLYVVRIIVPGLIPLFVGRYRAFYISRLTNHKEYRGQFNSWPHPMP